MGSSSALIASIVVCTYNRSEIVRECVESILQQLEHCNVVELIVVDNNSKDNTFTICQDLCKGRPKTKVIKELQQGLSYARNRGAAEAKGEYVMYVDDDARLMPNFINTLREVCTEALYDCFGGTYIAWLKHGECDWFPEGFGSKKLLRQDRGEIDGSNGWLCGGVFAMKRQLISELGGFDPSFGVSGQQLGYGEETDLQKRALSVGARLGFIPDLVIEHLVMPHKYSLTWHLKAQFHYGITDERLSIENEGGETRIFLQFLRTFCMAIFKRIPIACLNCLYKRKEYTWQKGVLYAFEPTMYNLGALWSRIQSEKVV